jgi:cytochrome P450
MLAEAPVFFDPDYTTFFGRKGVWQVFRHAEVTAVMSDYSIFSNGYLPKMPGNPLSENINQQDPPQHDRLRKLLMSAFSRDLIADLIPWMYEKCHGLLEKNLSAGNMDFVGEIANPFPSYVINRLLGIPGENHNQVEGWVNAIISTPDMNDIAGFLHKQQIAQAEMTEFFMALLQDKKQKQKNDLISRLITVQDNGTKLSTEEVFGTCMALIMAGNETTSGLLANAMYTFLEDQVLLKQLINNPDDISNAVNEVLRFRSPVQSHCRIATQDTVLNGKHIKQGDILNVWIGAANHDPLVFNNPEKFDITRNNFSRITSFGHGVHHCVGAVLSKLEAKVVFECTFKRLRNLRLQPNSTISMSNSNIVSSVQYLPITFSV